MNHEYSPKHLRPSEGETLPDQKLTESNPTDEQLNAAVACFAATHPGEFDAPEGRDAAMSCYQGTYPNRHAAVMELADAEDWEGMLFELSERFTIYGAFIVDWGWVETAVTNTFELLPDTDGRVHAFAR